MALLSRCSWCGGFACAFHRVIEWLGLKGTLKIIIFLLSATGQLSLCLLPHLNDPQNGYIDSEVF